MIDYSNSLIVNADNCTIFTSLDYLNADLLQLLCRVSEAEDKPAAIIHSKGRLVAANKAWVSLCDSPGEEVVQRDVSKGYMHPSTRKYLEERYSQEGSFEGRYTAFWSPSRCLNVINQMSRHEVAPGCWYSLNILTYFKETSPNGLTFEG